MSRDLRQRSWGITHAHYKAAKCQALEIGDSLNKSTLAQTMSKKDSEGSRFSNRRCNDVHVRFLCFSDCRHFVVFEEPEQAVQCRWAVDAVCGYY